MKDKSFCWRQQNGNFIPVEQMDTSHIYHTIKLIWNFYCPTEFEIPIASKYTEFGSYYTLAYLCEAIKALCDEFESRTDIPGKHLFYYNQIIEYARACKYSGPIAQMAERSTHNRLVAGSIPAGSTK